MSSRAADDDALVADPEPFPLLNLPDLVLQHVLTFLSAVERKALRKTCRKMCKVASAGVRHFRIDLDVDSAADFQQYLKLHDKFPNLQEVALAVWSDELVLDMEFASLVTLSLCHLKSLHCIDLRSSRLSLSAAGMCALLLCPHLKQLLLAPPYPDSEERTAPNVEAMMTIISQLSSLALLMLVPASEPTREWHIGHNVLPLLGRLHNLLRLELCCDPTLASIQALAPLIHLRRLALRGLPQLASSSLTLLSNLSSLRSLSLNDSSIPNEAMVHVGRCSGLTCLEIENCHQLSGTCMQHLQHLHKLACLRSSVALTSEGGSLQALIAGCGASLTLLEADSISAPVDFAGQLPLLTALALNLLNSSTPQLHVLAPRLKSLSVLEVSDHGITRALSGHTRITQLAMMCDTVSDAGLAALGGLTQLKSLTLADGQLLTADCVVATAGRLPYLCSITLCGLPAITDSAVAALVRSVPQLRCLGLQECNEVSDQGLALLGTLLHLQHFWVDSCSKVNAAAVMAIGALPSVARLDVYTLAQRQTIGPIQLDLLHAVKGPRLEVHMHRCKRPRTEVFAVELQQPCMSLCCGVEGVGGGGLWHAASMVAGDGTELVQQQLVALMLQEPWFAG